MASHPRQQPRKPSSQRRLPPGHGIGPSPDRGLGIGTRRAHLKPDQRRSVIAFADRAAGREFWASNDAAQRGDIVGAQRHAEAMAALNREAAQLRETLR